MRSPLFPVLLALGAGCTVHAEAPVAGVSAARAGGALRIVTWNIETVGDRGDTEYEAALAILARLDADVVGLQEIAYSQDLDGLEDLASDAGYDVAALGDPGFGNDLNAILSRIPVISAATFDGAAASGDPRAADLTRDVVVATLDFGGVPFAVAVSHLKSGTGDTNEFRRAVDERRAMQALFATAPEHAVFCGDLNEDLGDRPPTPASFSEKPSDLPSSYFLGEDLYTDLVGPGLPNTPFAAFGAAGLQEIPTLQLDGGDETRTSGRRLDYLFATPALAAGATGEVYDTFDEGLDGGLPKAGDEPAFGTLEAADHFPVFADFVLDGADAGAVPAAPGNVVLTEVMADPDACDDAVGEWVEVHNPTGDAVDLAGLVLGDLQGQGTVAGAGVLAPGGYAVLARSVDGCAPSISGTFSAQLANGGDEVRLLTADGAALDGFGWGSATSGRPWQRDGDTWCVAAGGGTPGAGNPGCP
jgi:endonuclease/exonuclease/phosphatase family metal-dependent hydrolase